MFATGEEKGVGFIKGTFTYLLTNYFGGKPPAEFDHLVVTNAEKEIADIRCSTDVPSSGNLGELADLLEGQGFKVVE